VTVMKWMFWIVPISRTRGASTWTANGADFNVQPQNRWLGSNFSENGQVTTVFLAPRYVTAIRMPEPINSVVVGVPRRSF